MVWPIIQRYVNSPNFDGMREAFELLKTIPSERWTQDMIRAVEEEALQNKQVAEAFPSHDSRPMSQAVSTYLDGLLNRIPF